MPVNKRKSNIVAGIACVLVALVSLAVGVLMGLQLQRMETVGVRAEAVVTRIATGAKNSKTAIVSFKTRAGLEVEAKCIFQMFAIRNETGDNVVVLYDPDNPQTVMIDNGRWNWDQPLFALGGCMLLLGLAVLILVSKTKQIDSRD